ncbi:hypothetical protein [Bosea sp. PAMC 26642]|uniref:hypothetical protein n=1 Tax=Bosea sp. (strain PAMC 26642) TaxID=1792307 RepID=UPI00076FF932|nr:hypothetical protein [Bosea sp. PAMC 26642]AMJ63055.1 hypothetical protein AXW83_24600 [Bosea sp. PAMC 26642]
MIQPATVGDQLAQGRHRVEIWCNPCSRHVEVEIDTMAPDLPIPDIAMRFRCSVCGGRNLTSRMSIVEFYERPDARRERS